MGSADTYSWCCEAVEHDEALQATQGDPESVEDEEPSVQERSRQEGRTAQAAPEGREVFKEAAERQATLNG